MIRRSWLFCEPLEPRRLLAGTAAIVDGTIEITGTDTGDLVTIGASSRSNRTLVAINGDSFEFHNDRFTAIHASLLAGTDVLQTMPLVPVSADMGAGDDRIEISGTSGNDAITVSARRVTIGAQTYDFTAETENVFVFGNNGAMDTLELVATDGVGTANVWFIAGSGSDILEARVPWQGRIHFDAGGSDDVLYAFSDTGYGFDGGDGVDRLWTATTGGTDHTNIYDNYYLSLFTGTTLVRDVNFQVLEQIRLEVAPAVTAPTGSVHTVHLAVAQTAWFDVSIFGSPDAEKVSVNNNIHVPTSVDLLFEGRGGDDVLEMQKGAQLNADYDGGDGDDRLVFVSGDGNDSIRADGDSVNDTRSLVEYLNVEHAELHGERGNDFFMIYASAGTEFTARGHGFGSSDPDELLQVLSNGGSPASLTFSTPRTDGTMWFHDRRPVHFFGMDRLIAPAEAAPVADAGGPYEITEGASMQLNGSGSSPWEGTITQYAWDYDYDGVTFHTNALGARPVFDATNMRDPLTRNIALRVTDSSGRTDIATSTVTITATPPPTANANGPYVVYVNGSVNLSAAGSSDPDGFISRYEWDLDYDGATFSVDRTGSVINFNASGVPAGTIRTVALRVIDNADAVSEIDTTTLEVRSSPPPTVNARGPYTAPEGGIVRLTPTGTAGTGDSIVRYEWDFDYDGTNFQSEYVTYPDGGNSTFTHNLDGPTLRNIAVRVVTNQGQTAIATTTLTVTNVAPIISVSGTPSVNEGSIYTLSLSDGGDPGDDTINSWTIDWGDGTIETIPGDPSQATHTYADGYNGYLISASATDEDGTYVAPSKAAVDTSFGGGWQNTDFGTSDVIKKLLPGPGGKIIAVGHALSGRVLLARYKPDGSLDTTFGTLGKRITSTGGTTVVGDAELQADGKIVVTGYAPGADGAQSITVLRYTADGNLDSSFAGDGIFQWTSPNGGSTGVDLDVLSDGRILVAARVPGAWETADGNSTTYNGAFALLRLMPDGTADTSFGGGDGLVDTVFSNFGDPSIAATPSALRVRADGSILVVGSHSRNLHPDTSHDVAIATYSADGTFQNVQFRTVPYGTSGGVTIGSVAFVNDDEFYIALEYTGPVVKLRVSDSSVRVTNLGLAENPGDLIPQPDGSVLVAGDSGSLIFLARIKPDGTRDTSFGTNGRVDLNTSATPTMYTALQTSDLHVVIGGTGTALADFVLARMRLGTGVMVTNVPPSVTATAPATGTIGEPVEISFSATDPGDDTISSWTINWGDGTIETLEGSASTASHTYARTGSLNIVVIANDEDGSQAAHPVNVQVRPQWQIVDRRLIFTGGPSGESVTLAVNLPDVLGVYWSGVSFTIPTADFDEISVYTLEGNDTLSVNDVIKPVTFDGGDGYDLVTFYGGDLDETIRVLPDNVLIDADGTAADRSLVHTNVERVAVIGDGGDDEFIVDPGDDSAESYSLLGADGNNHYELLSGPSGPPASPFQETVGVRIQGGAQADTAIVRPNANLTLSFFGGTTSGPVIDSLLFQAGDADDHLVVMSRSFSGAGSTVSASFSTTAIRVEGGGGNDTFEIRSLSPTPPLTLDGGAGTDLLHFVTPSSGTNNNFTFTDTRATWGFGGFDYTAFEDALVTGGATNETVTINATLPLDLQLNGGTGNDALFVTSGSFSLDSDAALTTSNLTVIVSSGATLTLNATQHLQLLNLHDGAVVRMPAHGDRYLFTRGLNVAAHGQLDLADNDLIWDYTGDSPFLQAQGYVVTGRAGVWGITSSTSTGKTVLAIVDNSAYGRTSWNGEEIDSTTLIGKYTYYGDSNLDGKVTGDDYVAIDSNLGRNPGTSQWFQGDFNFDGYVTGDDYVSVDANLGLGTVDPAAYDADQAEMIAIHAERYGGKKYVKMVEEAAGERKTHSPRKPTRPAPRRTR